METKEKSILYYIRCVKGRGEDIKNFLKSKCKIVEEARIPFYDNPAALYFVGSGFIHVVYQSEPMYKIILEYGTELYLPENPKILKWEDIKGV